MCKLLQRRRLRCNLIGFCSRAKTSYINAKDGASEAIANTYMVYLDVCSSEASQIGKDWFNKAIEDRNVVIKAHNTEIDDIKKSAHQKPRKALVNVN